MIRTSDIKVYMLVCRQSDIKVYMLVCGETEIFSKSIEIFPKPIGDFGVSDIKVYKRFQGSFQK